MKNFGRYKKFCNHQNFSIEKEMIVIEGTIKNKIITHFRSKWNFCSFYANIKEEEKILSPYIIYRKWCRKILTHFTKSAQMTKQQIFFSFRMAFLFGLRAFQHHIICVNLMPNLVP